MEARKASGPTIVKKTGPGAGGSGGVGGSGVLIEPKKSSPVHNVGLSHSQSGHSNKELTDAGTGVPIDTNITGKRIVEKLRSDVKGLRNAIRRSRKSNSR
jgi:hypothetical protein